MNVVFKNMCKTAFLVSQNRTKDVQTEVPLFAPAGVRKKVKWTHLCPNEATLSVLMKAHADDPSTNFALFSTILTSAVKDIKPEEVPIRCNLNEIVVNTFIRNCLRNGDEIGTRWWFSTLKKLESNELKLRNSANFKTIVSHHSISMAIRLFSTTLQMEICEELNSSFPIEETEENQIIIAQRAIDLAFGYLFLGDVKKVQFYLNLVGDELKTKDDSRTKRSSKLFTKHTFDEILKDKNRIYEYLRSNSLDDIRDRFKKAISRCYSDTERRGTHFHTVELQDNEFEARKWGLVGMVKKTNASVRKFFPKKSQNFNPKPLYLETEISLSIPVSVKAEKVYKPEKWFRSISTEENVNFEIGSGYGEWIVEKAKKDINSKWISCEMRHDRCSKILQKIVLADAPNVGVVCGDATSVMTELISPEAITNIFMLFPPKPTNFSQTDNAFFVQPEFLQGCQRVLRSGGCLRVLSDSESVTESIRIAGKKAGFKENKAKDKDQIGDTYFDRFWKRGGIKNRYYLILKKF
eukprot:GHVP01026186.1.p1 GENE.GHVP01026186.1~~GHVP01026186.1.p1  ORF type:complete len:588 (+),score=105.06 GHVP01026186.1:201-1766(+)